METAALSNAPQMSVFLYEKTERSGVTSIILVVIRPNTKVIINPMSIRCPSLRA